MFLSSCFRRWFQSSSSPAVRRKIRRCTPAVEVLEERDVPTTVTTLADSGVGSLRDALAKTPVGGAIVFASGLSGTIHLTSGILNVASNVTIEGPGAATVALDGLNANEIMSIASGVSADIRGLTFAHGLMNGLNGGAIANNGFLTLTNCAFLNNAVQNPFSTPADGNGGAIYSTGSLTVNACLFQNNQANQEGGAIDAEPGSTLVVNNCGFTGNSALQAGAILAGNGLESQTPANVTISYSTFTNNTSNEGGGALWLLANMTLTGSTFTNNVAAGAGAVGFGGAGTPGTTVTITDCTFSGNTALTLDGGAIIGGAQNATISDSTFVNNASEGGGTGGGAVSIESGGCIFNQDTFVGNSANYGQAINFPVGNAVYVNNCTIDDKGSGFYAIASQGQLYLYDSIVYGNIAQGFTSLGNNLFENLNGAVEANNDLTAPGIFELDTSTSGGTLGSGTYSYLESAVTSQGLTLTSSEDSITTGSGNTNTVTVERSRSGSLTAGVAQA